VTGGQRSDPFLDQATERVAAAYDDDVMQIIHDKGS